MIRKEPLVVGEIYHVFNKSIAGYQIYNNENDYKRMISSIRYFSLAEQLPKFSYFLDRADAAQKSLVAYLKQCFPDPKFRVQVIAYCLMPTHFHLIIRPLTKTGVTDLMHDALNSYSHYFNTKHERRGPLWVGPFKNVLVKSDEQLHHLTRYVHLNPVTASLVNKAEQWPWSSYQEYIHPKSVRDPLCHYQELLDFTPRQYRVFTEDYASYQRELAVIKDLLLD